MPFIPRLLELIDTVFAAVAPKGFSLFGWEAISGDSHSSVRLKMVSEKVVRSGFLFQQWPHRELAHSERC